jgi:hypothetical protein
MPEESPENEEYAVMEVATAIPEYFLLWHRRDSRGCHLGPTTRAIWDALVAQARRDIADVAKHAIGCIEDCILLQTRHLLSASQFMTCAWWGLNGAMTEPKHSEAVDAVNVQDLLVHLGRVAFFATRRRLLDRMGRH